MLIAVIGGKLQGTEIAYLAREAGYGTILIDRNPRAPASGLVDEFATFDIADRAQLHDAIEPVDVIFPALEDAATLTALAAAARRADTPIALDLAAYELSASKLRSNRLFTEAGIPHPLPFPESGFPVIAKPCFGSGGSGVRVIAEQAELDAFFAHEQPEDWCIQEYLEGPSYSVEVIGRPGDYEALLVTELFMDDAHDCMKVVAPATLDAGIESAFKAGSIAIAEALELKGVMDAEIIVSDGQIRFLEIDARFPSQTPIAVYHAVGINMVGMLTDLLVAGKPPAATCMSPRYTTLEHVRFHDGRPRFRGEHVMAECGPVSVIRDFFDSESAITSYHDGDDAWSATLLNRK